MKPSNSSLKLRRFEVNEKREKIADIELMIADFKRMSDDLSHQIQAEEDSSGIKDVGHYAYPTYAKAARQRRDNLAASIADLEAKLEEAKAELDEACEELKKSELVEERAHIEQSGRSAAGAQAMAAKRLGSLDIASNRP